ncbi:MAG: ROK family protein [Eubacteriales bacterium]|nr:ROK family protein [Eubacteriales bacterium]
MNQLVIDIGGTAIKSALYTPSGVLADFRETASDGREGAQALLSRLHDLIGSYAAQGIDRIGVSTAGQVDSLAGRIIFANDNIPGYTGTPLAEILNQGWRVPVDVENDVNAAALGEAFFGSARGTPDFLCLTYGTGIGGAIVMNGQIYRGLSGLAGEFGHLVTHAQDGLACTCGQNGCYEQYASAAALVRQAARVNPAWSNGRLLTAARDAAVPGVESVIENWAEEVACGLSSLIHSFNPSLIVLGGGILSDEDIFQQILRHTIDRTMPSFARGLVIRPALLGNQAGLYGMVAIGRKNRASGGI